MSYNIKSIKKEFKEKGIFYTPPELAELMKSYVDYEPKEVYDPTCGDGALLEVFGDIKKYGQEINEAQLDVAKSKLTNFVGFCGDTLTNPALAGQKFDLIMANPPFSVKWEPKNDERFCVAPVLPPPSKADYAFILHILHYMQNKAFVLSFPGIAYRGQREGKIREWLINQNYIEKVVHIPGDTFVDTKISTLLLVLNKNKTTTDIIFEDRELKKERTVNLNEIKENGYVLSVSTYVQKEVVKEDIDPVALEMDARKRAIKTLDAELKFSKQICEFENLDFNEFIADILSVVDKYK